MKFFLLYIILISIISCIVTVTDKKLAKKKLRRVPEKILFLLAAIGGSAVMYAAMLAVRHKTKHKRFMIGLPVIMALQLAVLFILKFVG